MICFGLLIHPFSRYLYITVGLLILAFGILLFQISGRIRADSGLSAILDLFTSLLGVCTLVFFLGLFRQQIRVSVFVLLSIVCGILSSASFRWRLKRPRRINESPSSH
jgi:hypothetical protein